MYCFSPNRFSWLGTSSRSCAVACSKDGKCTRQRNSLGSGCKNTTSRNLRVKKTTVLRNDFKKRKLFLVVIRSWGSVIIYFRRGRAEGFWLCQNKIYLNPPQALWQFNDLIPQALNLLQFCPFTLCWRRVILPPVP